MGAKMYCNEHGPHEWKGTVICAADFGGCGRVHVAKEAPPEQIEKDVSGCECGGKFSSLRAICAKCFRKVKKAGGRFFPKRGLA